jgi:hypothetical protein
MVGRSFHIVAPRPRAIAGVGSGTHPAALVDREDRHGTIARWHGPPVARVFVLVAVAVGVPLAGIALWIIIAAVVGVPWPDGVSPIPLVAPPGLDL